MPISWWCCLKSVTFHRGSVNVCTNCCCISHDSGFFFFWPGAQGYRWETSQFQTSLSSNSLHVLQLVLIFLDFPFFFWVWSEDFPGYLEGDSRCGQFRSRSFMFVALRWLEGHCSPGRAGFITPLILVMFRTININGLCPLGNVHIKFHGILSSIQQS